MSYPTRAEGLVNMYRERVCWTRATVVRRWAENYGTYFGGSPRRGPTLTAKMWRWALSIHVRQLQQKKSLCLSVCLSLSLRWLISLCLSKAVDWFFIIRFSLFDNYEWGLVANKSRIKSAKRRCLWIRHFLSRRGWYGGADWNLRWIATHFNPIRIVLVQTSYFMS